MPEPGASVGTDSHGLYSFWQADFTKMDAIRRRFHTLSTRNVWGIEAVSIDFTMQDEGRSASGKCATAASS